MNQGFGWRSNFYFLSVFGFLTWLGIIFGLPETWRASPVEEKLPSKQEAQPEFRKDVEKQSALKKRRNFVNPIAALKLLQFPNIGLAVTFVGVLYVCMRH